MTNPITPETISKLREEARLGVHGNSTACGTNVILSKTTLSNLIDALEAERAKVERAAKLVRLLTVRQVIEAGNDAINAAGLDPYCMNEGLADGSERISPSFLEQPTEGKRDE